MLLTCGQMTVHVTSNMFDGLVAESNVVVDAAYDGDPMHATGDRLVYTNEVINSATNEMIVMHGGYGRPAKIKSPRFSGEGDPIFFDLLNGRIWTTNEVSMRVVVPEDVRNRIVSPSGTNEPKQSP
jgi:hypothetical protein